MIRAVNRMVPPVWSVARSFDRLTATEKASDEPRVMERKSLSGKAEWIWML
jgi:hypothetical protein